MKRNSLNLSNRGGRARSIAAALPLAAMLLFSLPAGASAADALAVRVSPDRAHTTPGGSVGFSASVLDNTGAPVSANIVWTVIPPRLGFIDSAGNFTAGDTPGRAIVRASAEAGASSGAGHAVVDIGAEPPRRLTVVVSPQRAVLDANGGQLFTATVTDPVTGGDVEADIEWIIIPEHLGTIAADGVFTASSGSGSGRIAARAFYSDREGIGDAAIVVGTAAPSGAVVTVAPHRARFEPGGTGRFTAIVTDADGEPVDAEVEWTVMPRMGGTIDANGLFTAGPNGGAGRIIASVATAEGSARGIATVEIELPGPAGVTVRTRPRDAVVLPGDDVAFEAEVIGPDGAALDVPVDWAVTPGWIGTIGADGMFLASDEMPEPPQNGMWMGTVVASVETEQGEASGAGRVTVRDAGSNRRLRLRLHPARPILAPGQDVQFDGRVLGPGAPDHWRMEWAVMPAELGTVTPDGRFTANPVFGDPTSGQFGPRDGIVVARATLSDGSTLTARAHVRVRVPGQPVRIRISPAIATVEPGGTTGFDAVVIGPNGHQLDIPVTWTVRPRSIGTVTQNGVFTATGQQTSPEHDQRPRGLVVAQVNLPGGLVFRGAAAVIIDTEQP